MTTSTDRDSALAGFHPQVAQWFAARFAAPTAAQRAAWPLLRAGRDVLVAAPTGSGKTLTAFLAALDALVRESLEADGALPDELRVLYVSPLKALSNDVRVNLEQPLQEIGDALQGAGLPRPAIRSAVRSGDTPTSERQSMARRPPQILVTTPESLYLLLGSESGRALLATTRSVIVDEIHALIGDKRGAHLALSLQRLDALCGRRVQRIGLSATQDPVQAVAQFLVGCQADGQPRPCEVVDVGHRRARELALELPPLPLEGVMSNVAWDGVHDRLAELARQRRTTLVFVNTRRLAERLARHLGERLGRDAVAAHHGSLARTARLEAEQRLKRGELRLLVATASLELGIDIGEVELVCQIGSPGSINAFLQRVGRAGHQVDGVSQGRLFPTSRDDLVECAALLDCVRRGELDRLRLPRAPLDVLAQQIVAEVAAQEWSEAALFDCLRGAAPYAGLDRDRYTALLAMLAEGYSSRHGVRRAYLHRDVVQGRLRGRRGSRLTALSSGGTIPDNADYKVLLEPAGLDVGTVHEDFAVESLAGDIFQLGNVSYRILGIEAGRVRVEDAAGQPPNIPFWIGEAPGRSDRLSAGVARLRGQLDTLLADEAGEAKALGWLVGELALGEEAARQIVDYLGRARAVLGALPTQDCLIMERFFDASGGTQLIIHSPFGSRVNRAWGLALRKRFCRTFNFELQAAATEDAIVLSLSTSHSFPLEEVWRYLRAETAEPVLVQALLDAPLFAVRWRWNAVTALALPRMAGGRKVAPQVQRMRSEDLLAQIFPDQVACLENIVGERQVPEHPMVAQTLDDCLHDAMDADAWLLLLRRIGAGDIRLIARDLPAPSPLAAEVLGSRPYTFLDDAPLEERRTQAVLARRWSDPQSADELGALDADAIAAVAAEAWPQARDADELHEALMSLGCLHERELAGHASWPELLATLAGEGRALRLEVAQGEWVWLPRERLASLRLLYPQACLEPPLAPLEGFPAAVDEDSALLELLRARIGGFGPQSVPQLARPLAQPASAVAVALAALEREGVVMRGHFTPGAREAQWCERHLLARIHRYTLGRLRREIEPVEAADFMRFLFDWQRLASAHRGRGEEAVAAVIEQLEGFAAAATSWEEDLLPARIADYSPLQLDALCRTGRLAWLRLGAPEKSAGGPLRGTPIAFLPRRNLGTWQMLLGAHDPVQPSARAQRLLDVLHAHGASFFDELQDAARLLPSELENALGELVALGRVNADAFAGLRALLQPPARRRSRSGRQARPLYGGMQEAGRWAALRAPSTEAQNEEALETLAWVLLRRYGVVCWRLLARELAGLPPWRELLRVYRRLEARGEIRGGRFIAGQPGEQFALPEVLPLLREVRRRPRDGLLQVVSACDPLNLIGTLLPGARVPAQPGNRVLFRDGGAAAAWIAGKPVFWLPEEPGMLEHLRGRWASH